MAGIEIRGLEKRYPLEGGELTVFRGLDLDLREGAVTVVLGRSGCGKTTLLRLVGGLEQPDAGTIRFSGAGRTAYVFQEPRLMPWLNVKDNIEFGLSRAERDAADTRALLRTVGLSGFAKAMPAQLSGGMQQRVALGRALACRPSFIMMDEPFAALDYFTRESMQKELLRVRQTTAAGILFVTHSIDEALVLADKVVLLAGGTAAAEWPISLPHPRNLYDDAQLEARRAIMAALEANR